VTGTTTINSLGTGFVGCYRELRFQSALQLTDSGDLGLGGANITTATNDVFSFRCVSSGTWRLVGSNKLPGTFTSATLTSNSTYLGAEIGWRGIPRSVQNHTYSFVAADKGKSIAKTNTSSYTYTIPSATFSGGDVIVVRNNGSAGDITIAGSGVTVQLAGSTTTGNRTVAPGGLATIYFDSASAATVGGPGVS
jgi:hypothetical protein